MNEALPLRQAMAAAARSPWFAKTCVSARQIEEMARFAASAAEAIDMIAGVARKARDQGAALDPQGLIAFLEQTQLTTTTTTTTETDNGQAVSPNQDAGAQSSGAPDPR